MANRVAGCDMGKASAKFVVAWITDDGLTRIESRQLVVHGGHPFEAFVTWYREAGVERCTALAATGLHADELTAPVLSGLPEEACLEAALALRSDLEGPLNLVSLGARGYAVLTRNERGEVAYLENDKCSSGTGETMVKIAGRFGLSIEEADVLAQGAAGEIAITARCSVFAKSEMTHFGNQGRPADELFRGYFGSVARYVAALLARGRVPGPVYLIGGGSRIETFRRALAGAVGSPVIVPEDALFFEALGAAQMASTHGRLQGAGALPSDPERLFHSKAVRIEVLEPAGKWAGQVTRLDAPPVPEGAATGPSVLGLDLGSTGSKAVLTGLESGEILLDVYDRTRGNPVEAATRLVTSILQQTATDVRAIGITGSGREAVATVLRGVYPELSEKIVVLNEIVAHATAAIRCDPGGGESLSVVEIGGQDAKFIQIAGGQIVESDMNKACSAGTGSFLEEQAVFYGVSDIGEFTRMAQRATRPPNLGQMCTVFVAEAAAEAHNEGFSIEDLFAGFQYSVIHNYANRVMGARTFGRRVFFQGKPATGESLPWTLAAVSGRDVVVPPNPGAMGAWGIGLCAIKELSREALDAARAFDLTRCLDARIVSQSEFQCGDKKCNTLCRIDRTTVEVGGSRQKVLSGGACPKYEVSSAGQPKLVKEAPSAFDERGALLAPYLEEKEEEGPVVGVPHVGALQGYLPWLVTFLRELGLHVRVLASDAASLSRGEERCYSFDACAPVKIAHGVADAEGVDVLFLPKFLDLPDRDQPRPNLRTGRTCPMELGMPEMVEQSLRARGRTIEVLKPRFNLRPGPLNLTLLRQLHWSAERLGARKGRVVKAARRAAAAQRQYERALAGIGRRTLGFGSTHQIPVVVVCGSLHVIHDPGVNAGIPGILRQNGVLALPMDCLPVPEEVHELPRAVWSDLNRALRAATYCRDRGDAYPLLLSSFGCGPASFGEHVFGMLMQGYPHTSLESDGHGGQAGYVTRIQSFLHTVRKHEGRPSPVPAERLGLLEPLKQPPLTDEKGSRLVLFSLGDRLSRNFAAVFRSVGFDAVAAGPNSPAALSSGRKDCSGKECIAYQFIWGSFRKHLEENPPEKRTVLMQVQGNGACRNCMFSVTDQMAVRRMGLEEKVAVRHVGISRELRTSFATRFISTALAWDILNQLTGYHRPLEGRSGEVDDLYRRYCDELERRAEEPVREGFAGILAERAYPKNLLDLLGRASREFVRLEKRATGTEGLRSVFLSGDVYVRLDEFSSDALVRRLNERGLRVIVEPLAALTEYLASERTSELAGLPTGLLENLLAQEGMARMRNSFYEHVRRLHPWLPNPNVSAMMERAGELIDRYPRGEAPLTVGSVLHAWDEEVADGVVVAGPWGCGPALISESLLRHQRQIPILFLYNDGSPIDERRLNGFAFRLRGKPPRQRVRRTPTKAASPVASAAG